MSGTRNRDCNQLLLGEAADRVTGRDSHSSGAVGVRTLLDLLIREKKMDGIDHRRRRAIGRWNTLKQRLRLKGIGCCGASLGNNRSSSSPAGPGAALLPPPPHRSDDDEDHGVVVVIREPQPATPSSSSGPSQETGSGSDYSPRMNLGAALAAERQFRQVDDTTAQGQQHRQQISEDDGVVEEAMGSTGRTWSGTGSVPGTPSRVSLMRLMAEATDGCDEEREILGNDRMCCVCMERNKGAAFIPCGHTFCRVCTRELWLNRGSCPLCNRPILEILDIF